MVPSERRSEREERRSTPVDEVWTVREASAFLRMGRTKLSKLTIDGEIRSYKDGGSRRYLMSDVLAYARAKRGLES